MKHLLISLTVVLLLSMTVGCTKVIEFDGDATTPYIVMVSHPKADSTWNVRVTRSRFFLSNDTIRSVANAVFSVWVNGVPQSLTPQYMEYGKYDLGVTPHVGDTLTLLTEVPGIGTVRAGCRIPQPPTVSNIVSMPDTTIYTDYYYDFDSESGEYLPAICYISSYGEIDFKFTLHDPANQCNYYMLRVVRRDTMGNTSYPSVSINDNLLFDESVASELDLDLFGNDNGSYGRYVLFSDDKIDGQAYIINGSVDAYGLESTIGPNSCTYILEIVALSRDTYLYLTTLRHAQNQDELLGIFSEPVQIQCNVEGGIGILGAYATTAATIDTLTLDINDYRVDSSK